MFRLTRSGRESDHQTAGGQRRRAVRAALHRDAGGPRQARIQAAHGRPLPLGSFKRARRRERGKFRVNGKRLRPGRYLVSVRAVRARAWCASSASRRSSASAGAERPRLHWPWPPPPSRPPSGCCSPPRAATRRLDRGVKTVERALELYGAPVYVRRIVQNKHVVAQLRERGAICVEELDDTIPEGATTVFSAHGYPRPSTSTPSSATSSRLTPPARSSPRSTWRRRSSPPRATRSC